MASATSSAVASHASSTSSVDGGGRSVLRDCRHRVWVGAVSSSAGSASPAMGDSSAEARLFREASNSCDSSAVGAAALAGVVDLRLKPNMVAWGF